MNLTLGTDIMALARLLCILLVLVTESLALSADRPNVILMMAMLGSLRYQQESGSKLLGLFLLR